MGGNRAPNTAHTPLRWRCAMQRLSGSRLHDVRSQPWLSNMQTCKYPTFRVFFVIRSLSTAKDSFLLVVARRQARGRARPRSRAQSSPLSHVVAVRRSFTSRPRMSSLDYDTTNTNDINVPTDTEGHPLNWDGNRGPSAARGVRSRGGPRLRRPLPREPSMSRARTRSRTLVQPLLGLVRCRCRCCIAAACTRVLVRARRIWFPFRQWLEGDV